ncbi:hypothetical protein AB0L13_28155 [Saccharopolyspora shandongensis]|uniref:imine reductase family protein n=1 Tax=Saccharopolyspora shandongensis TaxID=418495 RepID=UPI00343578F8
MPEQLGARVCPSLTMHGNNSAIVAMLSPAASMNLNALEHIARTCVEQGVHADLPRQMATIAERAIAEGYGDKNYLAVFEIFKKAATPAS